MLLLRSLAFNVAFYALTAAMLIGGLFCLVSRRLVLRLAQTWARVTLWLLERIVGIRVEFRGLEHIPPGGIIVAAKHQSALETIALTTVLPNFTYILKRELLWLPLFGWYLSRGEMVPIDRRKGSRALALMSEEAAGAMAQGRQLIIFPEGTRRPPGAPPAYKFGVAHLYDRLAVPCLPVALNTGLVWPRNSLHRHPGTAVIAFLPPIPPGIVRETAFALIQERIETASAALLADTSRRGGEVPA
ncbi:phospholipid/glycerol acyltransferase [Methylobacterium sp. 4-46]|uniref:lysophospholipid acyltransferase family protein n=1 Tax=unclassified Methylobacterium TaxID=2615210 RepID=UPI000152D3FD|nr:MULTISPECIES: lysophospholipid acyltransferase family protein [Methylobacterium]ACA15502.1 phospholipid/glycerol acyltransferase [Methylobacterium sp. 4-46]WFT81218.1 lysophospholipid acyltransferase family protein [Methylobacterium nodulans]